MSVGSSWSVCVVTWSSVCGHWSFFMNISTLQMLTSVFLSLCCFVCLWLFGFIRARRSKLQMADSRMADTTTSTTKKRSVFLTIPLSAVVSLSQVPGIGPVTLERLAVRGITTPAQLVGQFMLLNRDRAAMVNWMYSECSTRKREGEMVAEALFEKSERMMVL